MNKKFKNELKKACNIPPPTKKEQFFSDLEKNSSKSKPHSQKHFHLIFPKLSFAAALAAAVFLIAFSSHDILSGANKKFIISDPAQSSQDFQPNSDNTSNPDSPYYQQVTDNTSAPNCSGTQKPEPNIPDFNSDGTHIPDYSGTNSYSPIVTTALQHQAVTVRTTAVSSKPQSKTTASHSADPPKTVTTARNPSEQDSTKKTTSISNKPIPPEPTTTDKIEIPTVPEPTTEPIHNSPDIDYTVTPDYIYSPYVSGSVTDSPQNIADLDDYILTPNNTNDAPHHSLKNLINDSDLIVSGYIKSVFYTYVNGTPWTQANVVITEFFGGETQITPHSIISIYSPGGFMPLQDYIDFSGNDLYFQDIAPETIKNSLLFYKGKNTIFPQIGDENLFFLKYPNSSIPNGAFEITYNNDSSMFGINGNTYTNSSLPNISLTKEELQEAIAGKYQ